MPCYTAEFIHDTAFSRYRDHREAAGTNTFSSRPDIVGMVKEIEARGRVMRSATVPGAFQNASTLAMLSSPLPGIPLFAGRTGASDHSFR